MAQSVHSFFSLHALVYPPSPVILRSIPTKSEIATKDLFVNYKKTAPKRKRFLIVFTNNFHLYDAIVGRLTNYTALATTHAITTVQAFVTSTRANGDMSASVTSRRITLHVLRCCIYGIHSTVLCFYDCCCTL